MYINTLTTSIEQENLRVETKSEKTYHHVKHHLLTFFCDFVLLFTSYF